MLSVKMVAKSANHQLAYDYHDETYILPHVFDFGAFIVLQAHCLSVQYVTYCDM